MMLRPFLPRTDLSASLPPSLDAITGFRPRDRRGQREQKTQTRKMPKTSSQCLTCLLDDDGMKDRELVARASVDESDNVKILSLLHKQGHKKEGGIQVYIYSCKNKYNPKPFKFPLS